MHDFLLIAIGAAAGAAFAGLFALARSRQAAGIGRSREAEITRLRDERREQDLALATLRAGTGVPPELAAENAELRRRMDELADAILAQSRREAGAK